MTARRAFTLIELLLAATLSAILLGGVLLAASALTRDARRLEARSSRPRLRSVVDLVQWDLSNARSISVAPFGRGVTLVGHGGISPTTRSPTNRLARVQYLSTRLSGSRPPGTYVLIRRQQYIDDPIDREPWTEVVAVDVIGLSVSALSGDLTPARDDAAFLPGETKFPTFLPPARVSVQIECADPAASVAQEVWTR